MYEYGARNYDPAVGRFFNIDRLSEKYESISPYNYTANNPVRFIDVDGEWIDIYDGGNKYRYQMGGGVQMYNKETKAWDVVEDTSSLSFYVQQIIANLYELETSGPTGSAVVGFFNNSNYDLNFRGLLNYNKYDPKFNAIRVNSNFRGAESYTTSGYLEAPFFIAIAHEMIHAIDNLLNPNTIQDVWFTTNNGKNIYKSEIFATHIENQIRAESGLPLRMYYGDKLNLDTGVKTPMTESLLLDYNHNSLYYGQSAPSIFNIGHGSYIMYNRYDYISNHIFNILK